MITRSADVDWSAHGCLFEFAAVFISRFSRQRVLRARDDAEG